MHPTLILPVPEEGGDSIHLRWAGRLLSFILLSALRSLERPCNYSEEFIAHDSNSNNSDNNKSNIKVIRRAFGPRRVRSPALVRACFGLLDL